MLESNPAISIDLSIYKRKRLAKRAVPLGKLTIRPTKRRRQTPVVYLVPNAKLRVKLFEIANSRIRISDELSMIKVSTLFYELSPKGPLAVRNF
jgi:hypothetical protein